VKATRKEATVESSPFKKLVVPTRSPADHGRQFEPSVTIRLSRDDDAEPIRCLAELDSRRAPSGRVMLAEVDGELVAAVPTGGGPAIADPFRRTAQIVEILQNARW
jgi:hypothetical protein